MALSAPSISSGFAYPVYASFKAVKENEVPSPCHCVPVCTSAEPVLVCEIDSKDGDLAYVLGGCWHHFDSRIDSRMARKLVGVDLLDSTGSNSVWYRIPFYYELKTLFILWLTLPQIQVSSYDLAMPGGQLKRGDRDLRTST